MSLQMLMALFNDAVIGFILGIVPSTEIIIGGAPEGSNPDAQYWWNTDGTVQERKTNTGGGSTTSTSLTSPWSTDPSETGSGFYVRCTLLSGTDRRYDALGTGWIQITSQRQFQFRNLDTTGPYTGDTTYTIDFSEDGSAVHSTQTLKIRLENEGP